MHCMKCGRKIKDQQVFCEECLTIMESYPVKPGTPIQLPTQPSRNAAAAKSSKRRVEMPEDQIKRLRSNIRWLTVAFSVALVAIIALVIMLFWLLDSPDIALNAADVRQLL